MSVKADTEVYGELEAVMLFLMQGHVLLQCEKLLLAECCLLPVFPYGLHWINSVQTRRSRHTL